MILSNMNFPLALSCMQGEAGKIEKRWLWEGGGGRGVLVRVCVAGKRSGYKSNKCSLYNILEIEKGKKKRIKTNHIPSKSKVTVVNILVFSLSCFSPCFC